MYHVCVRYLVFRLTGCYVVKHTLEVSAKKPDKLAKTQTGLTELVDCIRLDVFFLYNNVLIAILSALFVPESYSMPNLVDDSTHELTARTD